MPAYYNEIDPHAAQWLRNLISAGHIAAGDVDERTIVDVRPDDLGGYDQCHFFAGIGGWSLALRIAGWPDDRHVWTGSCPCQPFSAAGAGKAADDERHLWPAWFPLIAECRPPIIFGEQVEAAIGWGWLDAVFSDLESQGYACGASVLPACSVGAPHIRQRCWFVADLQIERCNARRPSEAPWRSPIEPDGYVHDRELAYSDTPGRSELRSSWILDGHRTTQRDNADGCGASVGMGNASSPRSGRNTKAIPGAQGEGESQGSEPGCVSDQPIAAGILGDSTGCGRSRQRHQSAYTFSGQASAWTNYDWLSCTDGKARPVEPGTFPLAHGIPGRVGRLRAYGNAIVPQVAAEFIRSTD